MADVAVDLNAIGEIAERLRALSDESGKAYFRDVFDVMQLAGLDKTLRAPFALVYPITDDAGLSLAPKAGALQLASAVIGVTVALKAPNDPAGSKVRGMFMQFVGAVRREINGWTPTGARYGLQWRSGHMIVIEDSRALWEDRFLLNWVIDQLPINS